jgi:hypothetical protein
MHLLQLVEPLLHALVLLLYGLLLRGQHTTTR